MLVLSRKSAQDLVFPALGITIRVLKTGANCVKLGIIAPKQAHVVRGELVGFEDLISSMCDIKEHVHSHELRNRVNALVLKLELLSRIEKQGLTAQHPEVVDSVTRGLAELDETFRHVAEPVPSGSPCEDKVRLLVVDDDANERELLAAVLSLQGFEISAAEDGVQALEWLNHSRSLPDAVLMDMHMPRLDGETTLRCIRADSRLKQLRVIGVSGNDPQLQLLPDEFRGFDAWFTKPLKLDRLVSLIQEPQRSLH